MLFSVALPHPRKLHKEHSAPPALVRSGPTTSRGTICAVHRQLFWSGHGHDNSLQSATSRRLKAIQTTVDRPAIPDHVRRPETAIPGPVCLLSLVFSSSSAKTPSCLCPKPRRPSASFSSTNSPRPRVGMKWSAGASSRDLSQRHGRSYRFVPPSGAVSATVPARVVADLLVAASATIILGDSPATEDVAPKSDGAPEPSATPGQRSSTPIRTSSHGM